jgi:uncharacterized cupin superfamily protein
MNATIRAVRAADAPPRAKPTTYPAPYAAQMDGRIKQTLGDLFGLRNFGVNRVTMKPGGISALMHKHSRQDEMVFILEGEVVLVTPEDETLLTAGMCAGFPAGGAAHQLINRSERDAVLLEIGDRSEGDVCSYPMDDLVLNEGPEGWHYSHKDGRPY